MQKGFTLLELGIAMVVITILALLGFGAAGKIRLSAAQAKSTSNLRQLGLATQLYLADEDYHFFSYRRLQPEGVVWWYGFESNTSMTSSAGTRVVDKSRGPLFPYLQQGGGVEICPGFEYASPRWKPKYQGATYGYGYNITLCSAPDAAGNDTPGWGAGLPYRLQNLTSPSATLLFATCAQVQGSAKSARIEEFPGFDAKERVIHGRFNRRALVVFVDGRVDAIALDPLSVDSRLPGANIGRFPASVSYK